MQDYEERQERKRERLENAAEKAANESAARIGAARRMTDHIPFGQPILVGHHSEKRHRRDLDRINSNMSKGFEAHKRAEELSRRADAIGTGGVSSDDPAAVAKLEAELAKLEAMHARMKTANVLVRKKDRAGLIASGFTEKQADGLLTPDFCGRLGFPSYAITNNGANIRRVKERIESLRALAVRPVMETIEGEGWTITEDADENRVLISFDEKPSAEMRAKLRSAGFVWSPTRSAHVRKRSNGAIYAAKYALGVTA